MLYLVKDGGILTSVDAKTGSVLKQGRLTGAVDTYYSSPVAGAGHVYAISQTGKAVVLKAGALWEIEPVKLTIEGRNHSRRPPLLATASLSAPRSTLYCFGE